VDDLLENIKLAQHNLVVIQKLLQRIEALEAQ